MASDQLAVLFADVCDSTTIYEAIGDTRALSLITQLLARLDEKVKASAGTVIKTVGDGLVCQFKDADAAFHAACGMQEAAVALSQGAEPKLSIKVGFNWGPVVTEGGDVFGDTMNVCARLVSVAGPEQVLTTQEAVDALAEPLRRRCRQLYPMKVRGRIGDVNVCDVLWRSDDPDVTEAMDRDELVGASTKDWVLKVSYAGDSVLVEPGESISIGRDKGNDIIVNSTHASRVHARISGRGAHFVIADQSSNGTFLLIDGNPTELQLRREEGMLGERGYIGLGDSASGHGDHVVRYRLVKSREG
ncbi:MAG TPA: adenylate/guanylate cyclase domain-containing protein [Burkholderiales bacterium]|nr:adenylate/guanylate cyclase domain-containing protein [Burkholderiales bacterium]